MTPSRTQTGAIETAASVASTFSIVANPANLPLWAPGFADAVQLSPEGGWQVTKAGNTFLIATPTSEQAGTTDFLRTVAPGRQAGAYLRILPGPRGGSVIVLTLPILPGATEQETAAIVAGELQSLASLIEPNAS